MADDRSTLNPLYYTNISKNSLDVVEDQQITLSKRKQSMWDLSLKDKSDDSYKLKFLEINKKKNYQQRLKQIFIPSRNYLPSSEMPNSLDPRKVRQSMRECMKELLKTRYKYPAIDEIDNEFFDQDQSFQSAFRLQKLSGSITTIDPITGRLCQMSVKAFKDIEINNTSAIIMESEYQSIHSDSLRIGKSKLAIRNRRNSNTGNNVTTGIHSSNDENNGNSWENIDDNSQDVNCYPELIADAVGSPVNQTFSLNKASIKLKYSFSKHKNFKLKNDDLSSQVSSDEVTDDYISLSDSISSPIGKKTSASLNSRWKFGIQQNNNTFTKYSCIAENFYEQSSASEDLSDMETTIGTSKHKRISRIPNNLEKSVETLIDNISTITKKKKERVQEKLETINRRIRKRKKDCTNKDNLLSKVQRQYYQSRKLNSVKISNEEHTSDSSLKKLLLKRNEQFISESSLRSSTEHNSKKARHLSSPYPDKKRRAEKNLMQTKNIDRAKSFDQKLISCNDFGSERDRSHTESIDTSKIQSKEIETRKNFSDEKELKKRKQFIESRKQKTTRNSTDSGIGRITPTHETVDNTELKEEHFNAYYKLEKHHTSSKNSRRSEYSSTPKSSFDEETIEILRKRKKSLKEELKKIRNHKTSVNKPLSLPFINDSDGCGIDDNLTHDDNSEEHMDTTNKSPRHKKVISENKDEILGNEIESNNNKKIHDNSAIYEEVKQLLSKVVDYSSSSDDNDDQPNLITNKSSVQASDLTTEFIKTNSIENKTSVNNLNDDSVRHNDDLAKSEDDKSVNNNKTLDINDWLKKLSKSSQNHLSIQNSSSWSEPKIKLFEMINEWAETYSELLKPVLEFQKKEDSADSSTQKSLTKISNNDKLELQYSSITPSLTQTEATKILDKDSAKKPNLAEFFENFQFNVAKGNLEGNEVHLSFLCGILVPVLEIFSSDITTSTPSTSTTTLSSSTNPVNSPTILTVPTTSLITTGSQSSSHSATINESCSSIKSVSHISTPTFLTATSTTQQLPSYQNPPPPYQSPLTTTLRASTPSQLHSNQNPSTTTLSTLDVRKSPPPYSSTVCNEHCSQENNSSSKQSACQMNEPNISSEAEDISITTSKDCRQLMHNIIESIFEIRKFFKEFESMIQDTNFNPSSFASHSLFISVTEIFQYMSKLRKLLGCDWKSLYTKITSYSESYEDSTKRISLHDIVITVHMYCCGNNVPTELSSIYPSANKTAKLTPESSNNINPPAGTLQPSVSFNTTELPGEVCNVPGCIFPNCSGELATNSLSSPTTNHDELSSSLPIEPISQQLITTQVKSALTTSMRVNQNLQSGVQTPLAQNLLPSNDNTQNYRQFQASYRQFQASTNQPFKNIQTQAAVLPSDIYYIQPQQQNNFLFSATSLQTNNNQQFYNQAGNFIPQQSNVIPTPVGLSTISNQQYHNQLYHNQLYHNQSITSKAQQLNVAPTPVPYFSANNNQEFYNTQLYNQEVSNQSSASVSLNANNNQQYSHNRRNLILLQPNIASMPISSSQTADNVQYNNEMSILINQQLHNQQIYNEQSYNQSTTYQQRNSAQPLLNPNFNNQQYNNKLKTSMSQQPYNTSIPISTIRQYNNIPNASIPQQPCVSSTPKLSSNNNQQNNNKINVSTSQLPSFVAPLMTFSQTNNNQRYNCPSGGITSQKETIVVATKLPSEINHDQQHNNQPKVLAQQLKNVPTSTKKKQSRNIICKTVPKKRSLIKSLISIQPKILRKQNRSKIIRAQIQQPSINPLISLQPDGLQKENCSEIVQAQTQKSINPPPPVNFGVLQDSHTKTTIKKSRSIVTTNNQRISKDNSITVSQALESLSSVLTNKEDSKKLHSSKPKTQKSKILQTLVEIPIDTNHEKACSNKDIQNSLTQTSVKKNKINHNTTEKIDIKPDLDKNDSLNSSQQVSVQTETSNDLILVEVKKERKFLEKNKPNHEEDLCMDIDLRFLNDIEYDKDSQESIKKIQPSTSKNVSTNQEKLIKTEKLSDKVNIKSNDGAYKKKGSIINNDVITLDDNDDDDLDRVSTISSDRETVKLDQSEDEIIIEEVHIASDTYFYTKASVNEEIDCAILGGNAAFSNVPVIANIATITSDDFNNIKEVKKRSNKLQTNDVPEEVDIKLEINEDEYFVV